MIKNILDTSVVIKKSSRSKRLRVSVSIDKKVTVTVPSIIFHDTKLISDFVHSQKKWIINAQKRFDFRLQGKIPLFYNNYDYKQYKNRALNYILNKISKYNYFYGFRWNELSVKNQRSRWGSCSESGGLNFNFSANLQYFSYQVFISIAFCSSSKKPTYSLENFFLNARSVAFISVG